MSTTVVSFPARQFLADEAATVACGEQLGRLLQTRFEGNALVFLRGDLGAGKTTLVRGVLRSLGHSGAVKSPTYTLLEPYACNGQDAYHFDLYRVNDPHELAFVGFDEVLDGPGLKLVEWADKALDWLPLADVEVTLEVPRAVSHGAGETNPGREIHVQINANNEN